MLQMDGLEPGTLPLLRRELAAMLGPRLRAAGTRTMLVGEAGIGKTYLIEALLDTALSGRPVLRTRLRPENGNEAFFAIRDLLRSARWGGRGRTPERLRTSGEVPVRELAGLLQSSLRRLASSGVVVVIDGWQWLDPESRSLLERELQEAPLRSAVSLLATRRLDGSAEDLAVQPLYGTSDIFAVEPLPPRTIIDLVRSTARSYISDSVAFELGQASHGNPLLALELAASADGGDPSRDAPNAFLNAMRERVLALDIRVRLLLATLSVMGPSRASEIALVCTPANEATGRALDIGVVQRHGDELIVSDPLLAAIAAEQLTDYEKQQIHAKLADAPLPSHVRIEHRDDAAHAGIDEDLASELLDEAGRVQRADEPETALRLTRRALDRTDRDDTRYWERTVIAAELAAGLANSALVLHLLRNVDFERLDLALLDRATPLLALALARRGGATAVRRRLLPLRTALTSPTAKDVTTVQLLTIGWEGGAGDQSAEIARAADRIDPTSTPRSWRITQQWVAVMRLDQGGGLLDGELFSIESSEFAPAQLKESVAVLNASWAYQSDDLGRSWAALTAIIRAADLVGEDFVVVQSLAHLAKVEMLAGRMDQALPHLEEAEARAAVLMDIPPSLIAAKGLAAVQRHDNAALQILVDDPQGLRALGRGEMIAHALLGLDAAYSNNWDLALEELVHARQVAENKGIYEPGRRFWIDIELARAYIATGDLTAADAVAAHLESVAAAPTRTHARGQAMRIRALTASARGDRARAADLLRRAIVELGRGGYRSELVRARAEYALVLHTTGEESESARQLDLARREATMTTDPRLGSVLQDTAHQITQDSASAALSGAEVRVAALAASGDANRRIAEKLFLSPRTVETHLANIYRKLGVRTRTQMMLALQRPVKVFDVDVITHRTA